MGGSLFVPHVDYLNPLIGASVVDIHDVPAAQRKDRSDPLGFREFCHKLTACDFGHRLILFRMKSLR
jgi:hypothetical protein